MQEKNKILFTILLCGLSALISTSHSFDSKINAYGQTPDSSTDPSASTGPTDNSTDPSASTGPTDNFANLNSTTNTTNQTGLGNPNSTNTTSQISTTQSAIPEFGPVAQVVLIIAVFSMIIFRTKTSNTFKN